MKTIELTDVVCGGCNCNQNGKVEVKSHINIIDRWQNYPEVAESYDAELLVPINKDYNKKSILPAIHFLSEGLDEKIAGMIFSKYHKNLRPRKINIKFEKNIVGPDIYLNLAELYSSLLIKPINYIVFNKYGSNITLIELIKLYGSLEGTTFPSSLKLLKTSDEKYKEIKNILIKKDFDHFIAEKYDAEIAMAFKGISVNSNLRNRYLSNNNDIGLVCLSKQILITEDNDIVIRRG